jgi:hypothetical protein
MNSSSQPPEDSTPDKAEHREKTGETGETGKNESSKKSSKKGFDLAAVPDKYWALAAMVLWGGAILFFGLIRLDNYAMDEGGAMALLLAWSVAEKVVIPVTVLGGPDVRALFFWPVALYWPGNMLAAKIFTMTALFGGAYALFRWSRQTHSQEVALIATGLLLIAPLTILQIDAVASAPFLLGAFGLGHWLDKKYNVSPHAISSWYFLQMLLVAATVTLHPMGLAYPLALAWQWHRRAQENSGYQMRKKQVWLGVSLATVIVLIMQLGWIDIHWFTNPLGVLNQALLSVNELDPGRTGWILGAVLAVPLIVIIAKDYQLLSQTLIGSMLLAAVVIGLVAAGRNWAVIAMALLLYRGFPLLIEINKKISASGFMGQRGLVLIGMMVFAVLFMRADKLHAQFVKSEILSPVDELIRTLSREARDPDKAFIAASQWPARTMLVCRRDVLHLPPPRENGEQFLASIKGVTHIMFDHRSPANDALNRNLSQITGFTQTLAIQQAGVIIKIKTGDSVGKDPTGNAHASQPTDKNDSTASGETQMPNTDAEKPAGSE